MASVRWRILYDFKAEEDGELSVHAGEFVRPLDDASTEKDGWMLVEAEATNASGFIPTEYAVPFSPSDNTAAPAALASSPASAPAHPRQEAAAAPAPAAPATPFAAPPSPAAPMGSATSSDNALLPAALRSMLVTPAPASASSASSVSPPGGGPSAGSGALSRSLLPPAAVEQPFPSFAPSLAGTSLGAASLLPPVQPSSSSGGPSLEDVGRYFAAHEEWYRTATLKRQETYRALQGDCVDLLRALAEGEGRSGALLGRIGELEALIADERGRWSQRLAEDAAVAK